MASIRISDVVKPFSGEGDVTVWLKKLKMVAKSRKVEELATLIPLFLEGPAYTVFDQMEETDKENEEKIEKVLLEAFSINKFHAYDLLRQRNWQDGEQVDVYLSEIRKLAKLAGVDSEELLTSAFVVGLPAEVSSQLKASAQIANPRLGTIVEQARILMEERTSLSSASAAAAVSQWRVASQWPHSGLTEWRSRSSREDRLTDRHEGSRPPGRGAKRVQCWNCGKEGHMARNCYAGKGQGESRAPAISPERV